MAYDYHIVLGTLAAFIGIVSYIPYYRDMFRDATKPHPFTWFGFGFLDAIVFFAQISKSAGAGAWVTAVNTIGTFGIAVISLKRGEKDITPFDWTCFVGAGLGITLWFLTKNPLWAVILVTGVSTIAFAPTFRKVYWKPNEETMSFYILAVLKWVVGLFALNSFNLTTALFPASLVISNSALVILLLIRRHILAKKTSNL